MIPSVLVMVGALAAIGASVAVAVVRHRRRPRGDIGLALVPIADRPWGRIRVDVTNTGGRTIDALQIRVAPAPPAVRPWAVAHVIPPAARAATTRSEPLTRRASASLELECPLRPGPLYRRVLGLDPDDDEPVYGLPIETLLAVDVRWRERGFPWPRLGGRALVRGRYLDRSLADETSA